MHLVWINKSPWRKPGPIVPMGIRNAAACASLGHPTDLFLSADQALSSADSQQDLQQFYGLSDIPATLTLHLLPSRRSLHPLRPVYRHALKHLRHLLNRLPATEPILALTREEGLLAALLHLRARSRGRLRVIHETHDFFANINHLERPDWNARRRQQLARRLFPQLDGLLCLTDEQIRLYREHLPRPSARPELPILALPLGTEERRLTDPETLRQRRTLSYVGHLHHEKGQATILEAAPALSQHGISLQILGGNPEQASKLQTKLHKRMKGSGQPQVLPFLPPEEMHQQLAEQSSIGLILLTDTFYNRHLTCPVKALDALSHGQPALASDLPSTHQVLQEAALYIPPSDPQALTQAALTLLDDPQHFAQKAQAARQRRQQLLWQERARQIITWQQEQ